MLGTEVKNTHAHTFCKGWNSQCHCSRIAPFILRFVCVFFFRLSLPLCAFMGPRCNLHGYPSRIILNRSEYVNLHLGEILNRLEAALQGRRARELPRDPVNRKALMPPCCNDSNSNNMIMGGWGGWRCKQTNDIIHRTGLGRKD